MAETLIASAKSGRVEHCMDSAKKSGVFPLDAAILLWHMAGHKLKVETEPFLLCLVLECDILTGVVASNLANHNVLFSLEFLDQMDHRRTKLILRLQKNGKTVISCIIDN